MSKTLAELIHQFEEPKATSACVHAHAVCIFGLRDFNIAQMFVDSFWLLHKQYFISKRPLLTSLGAAHRRTLRPVFISLRVLDPFAPGSTDHGTNYWQFCVSN